MAKDFCISLNKLHKGNSSKWIYSIIILVIVLAFVIHKYNKNSDEEDVLQNLKNGIKQTDNTNDVENFREQTRGTPINVFSSNWPYPPAPLEKYRFCGNDGFCNPGHQCSDKLFGAMFPPICNCYQLTKKDLQRKNN